MKRTQLVTTADLSREEVDFLINEADNLRNKRTNDLEGRIVATMFFEPSTRTRLSFEAAACRLGAKVIGVADASTTSTKKGETMADTIRIFDKFADCIVMRQPVAGVAEEMTKYTDVPLINGGDGSNQHPTQALLDLYTIFREQHKIDGLTLTFVGDLKYGRTVHSLLYLVSLYEVKINFVSPKALAIPDSYKKMLDERGVEYKETESLEDAIPESDILYMTRVQGERFEDPAEFEKLKDAYILTADLVKTGKDSMSVMHPLPRVNEISTDVDDLRQAAYFRQVKNGLFMRMGLLKTLIKNYEAK